jgi:predicted Rdx family selenoprotein
LAEALVIAFKPVLGRTHPIEQITLIPSGNGRFEVTIDEELVYSKAATGEHTTNEYIIQKARVRLLD